MRYENITDIYSANAKFRAALTRTLTTISDDEATARPDGEKWSIQQIAEHVSMVDDGISRICSKLLNAAEPDPGPSDGSFSMSEAFQSGLAKIADAKLEAPDRVQPSGEVSIKDSIERIEAADRVFASLKPAFERVTALGPTFPHPYLGELTACEWLVMSGLHKGRHTRQIERLAARIKG